MAQKINTTTVERVLTDPARTIFRKYTQRYGTIKNALSAAVMGLELLSAEQREKAMEMAYGDVLQGVKEKSTEEMTPEEKNETIRKNLPDPNCPVICLMDPKQQKLYRSLIKSLEPDAQAKEKQA